MSVRLLRFGPGVGGHLILIGSFLFRTMMKGNAEIDTFDAQGTAYLE